MMGRVWIVLVLLCAVSCGSDDEKSDNEKLCDQGNAKARECGVGIGGLCDSPCVVQCVINAQCDEIRGRPPNPFFVCQASCQGVTDPFFCENGHQFLPKSEVCNGAFQCLDGSDERNCADAGS
jgi:hypothetical protein